MNKRSTAGFSVLELTIALVIIGIAAVAILPRMSRSIQSSTAQGAASVIAADLETASATAARSRRPVYLQCDCSSLSYRVADQAGDTLRVFRKLDGASGMQVTSLRFSTSPVYIGPNGLATAPDTVTVTVGSSTRKVVMSRTGLVRILTS